jgi:hypothetical protein
MKTTITVVIEHSEPFPEEGEIDIREIVDHAEWNGLLPIRIDHYEATAQTDDGPMRNLKD